jgi:hypothetical protein
VKVSKILCQCCRKLSLQISPPLHKHARRGSKHLASDVLTWASSRGSVSRSIGWCRGVKGEKGQLGVASGNNNGPDDRIKTPHLVWSSPRTKPDEGWLAQQENEVGTFASGRGSACIVAHRRRGNPSKIGLDPTADRHQSDFRKTPHCQRQTNGSAEKKPQWRLGATEPWGSVWWGEARPH